MSKSGYKISTIEAPEKTIPRDLPQRDGRLRALNIHATETLLAVSQHMNRLKVLEAGLGLSSTEKAAIKKGIKGGMASQEKLAAITSPEIKKYRKRSKLLFGSKLTQHGPFCVAPDLRSDVEWLFDMIQFYRRVSAQTVHFVELVRRDHVNTSAGNSAEKEGVVKAPRQ